MTFDHPPINTITATTMRELSELVDLIERDTQLKVVVFDSANPDFFLAQGPDPVDSGTQYATQSAILSTGTGGCVWCPRISYNIVLPNIGGRL